LFGDKQILFIGGLRNDVYGIWDVTSRGRQTQSNRQMTFNFDPAIQKSPVISAPFRRKLFEPVDSPLAYRAGFACPIARPTPSQERPVEPIIGPNGNEYFRISDVKQQIETEVREIEGEVHSDFMRQLTAYLAEQWGRDLLEAEDGLIDGFSDPTDLPDMYK
jgi:hypothetical protein